MFIFIVVFFFQAEDGIRDKLVTGVQTCALPILLQVLEGENAVSLNREIMGATNPDDAAEGTIRREFALDIGENSVHGSDSLENAI